MATPTDIENELKSMKRLIDQNHADDYFKVNPSSLWDSITSTSTSNVVTNVTKHHDLMDWARNLTGLPITEDVLIVILAAAKYINNLSEEKQIEEIEKDSRAMPFILNPSDVVRDVYIDRIIDEAMNEE